MGDPVQEHEVGLQDESPRPRRRWLAMVLMGIFTAIGLFIAVLIGIDFLQGVSTYSWEETTCTIERSEVADRSEYDDFEFLTTYRYSHRGEEYRSSDYRHGYTGSSDASEAHRLAARYAVGESVPCYFDPKQPWFAYLRRANLWSGLLIFAPLLFVAIGIFGMRMANSGLTGTTVSLEEGKKDMRVVGGMTFMFGMFFLIGFGMLIPFFIVPALEVVEARSWQPMTCEIISSGVRTHSSDDGSTYSVEAVYRYEIDGREYVSNRYQFMGGSSSGYDSKAEAVAKIPAGSRADCYVDPDDPFEAVIDRGFGLVFLFGLIPLLFGVIGAGGLSFVFKVRRDALREAAAPSWTQPAVAEGPSLGAGAGRTGATLGPIDLEPTAGPFGKLALTLFFALFWNGIVSVFVWQLVSGWREGHFDWFLGLFLTPFVLIGLLLLSSIPYSVLALVNPRPRLRLSSGVLRPGQSVQLDWSFRGAASRIRSLRIWLEATRASSGGRGRAHPEPLREVEVLERGPGFPSEYGSVGFTVPRDAEPTSDGDPRIGWKLKLHGTIDYWPDVIEEYEIEVVPGGRRL